MFKILRSTLPIALIIPLLLLATAPAYSQSFDKEMDASGLNQPLPILRAKKTLNQMESGQVLKVIATDPGSVGDFDAFSKQTGHTLLESSESSGRYIFLLKKK